MDSVVVALRIGLNLYAVVLLIYGLSSLFATTGAGAAVRSATQRVVDPVLDPLRRVLPTAHIGGVGLDVAFMLVFVALRFVIIPALG